MLDESFGGLGRSTSWKSEVDGSGVGEKDTFLSLLGTLVLWFRMLNYLEKLRIC